MCHLKYRIFIYLYIFEIFVEGKNLLLHNIYVNYAKKHVLT